MGSDPTCPNEVRFDPVVEALREAHHVCVLTGAGISAESGVPTFREAQQGLWAKYDPLELATPEAFARDPALVWRWYHWRRELVANAEPNAGHRALVDLANRAREFTLITQNVDGLHQRAGSRAVVEFHGNLFHERCMTDCGFDTSNDQHGVDDPDVKARKAGCAGKPDPVPDGPDAGDKAVQTPRCPGCGALTRPAVVWFGEAIPEIALERAFRAAVDCDVFLSVGTSSLVYPAAGLADVARQSGAVTVEINAQKTERSPDFDRVLTGEAGTVLPELIESLARHEHPGEIE